MSKKKKIGVIGLKGLPAFGGAATVGENIIDQLKSEYDFTVYSTSSHTECRSGPLNGYVQVVFPRIRWKRLNTLLYYMLSAIHAVLFSSYDLIHLHHKDAAFIVPFLKLRYKVILTTHGSFGVRDKWKRYKKYFEFQEKYFVKTANIATCVSKNEQRGYKKIHNLDVKYIPNGINLISISELYKSELKEDYIFFGAGRIIKTKGCEIFLKSLKLIDYQGKIVIAGDLNQTQDYRDEIMHLAKGLNVEFFGLIRDKKQLLTLLSNAKLFVFPSSREAMSMMLLEGLSVKARTVCSDIIQNRDVVTENEVLFFETDNIKDLASKITWAINNIDLMNLKAENAYSLLISNYSWSKISESYSYHYESLLK